MKATKLCTASMLFLIYFSACNVHSAKVVETEEQTLECIVGTWVPEEPNPVMNNIEFHAPEMVGEQTGTVSVSGGIESMTGTWHYQSIAEINLTNTDGMAHFKLLDCTRGILDGLTIYVKK